MIESCVLESRDKTEADFFWFDLYIIKGGGKIV